MADVALRSAPRVNPVSLLFTVAIFTSASLVFLVQPMMGKMLLPKLGGSPAVWNTTMAFFQAALLAGYGYAHLLQKLRSLRAQAAIHLAALLLAVGFLPLHLPGVLGDPPPNAPVGWLLAALTISVGYPFAILSSTAPLLQAWFARLNGEGSNPYALYVASNVGSMLALLAYPTAVEPLLALEGQTHAWAIVFAIFVSLAALVGASVWGAGAPAPVAAADAQSATGPTEWRTRAVWILLAAAPSSLMLGTTTFLSTDVAATPFLWVLPLALYLATFIVAFQDRPAISPRIALVGQG
ncbi:MAG TPA: spermidine synthase, partial [Phenylobacterium sp.]|nr:spermidine synthase [Phenylobacterium sp.]